LLGQWHKDDQQLKDNDLQKTAQVRAKG
jgi:hypothetical protein